MHAAALTILVNGSPEAVVSPVDRGLLYGDGLFETMRVDSGRVPSWSAHLQRLLEGCDRLAIARPSIAVLEREVDLLLSMAPERAVLKLIVTRGSGGRGYRPPAAAEPTRILQLHPWPDHPPARRQSGVAVRLCATRLGINPALAGLKHLNRLEQVLARAEWQDEFEEGLMLDVEGRLVAGTMSNLFLIDRHRLRTPAITRCGVRGIMRGVVVEAAHAAGVVVEEVDLSLGDLRSADGAFLTNALIGLWPIRVFEDRHWSPHPLCQALMETLGDRA